MRNRGLQEGNTFLPVCPRPVASCGTLQARVPLIEAFWDGGYRPSVSFPHHTREIIRSGAGRRNWHGPDWDLVVGEQALSVICIMRETTV